MIKDKEKFLELLKTKDYDFLRKDCHLGDNIILLCLGGSHAYGTNIEGSDVDIRGIALNRKQDIIGISTFDQYIDSKTDTTIYSFDKILSLLMQCNPNIIEMLGFDKEDYLYLSPEGEELLDNIKYFISQKVVNTFGGYANMQLRKIQNALARDVYDSQIKEDHISKSVIHAYDSFSIGNRYTKFKKHFGLKLKYGKAKDDSGQRILYCSGKLKKYPLRELRSMLDELTTIVRDYDKIGNKNKKKDIAHLNKHAMHLVRLYLTAIEILETGAIRTYRKDDREELLAIRNGKYELENPANDKSKEFYKYVDLLEKRLQNAIKHTSIPKNPNYKKIEEFKIKIDTLVINKKGN